MERRLEKGFQIGFVEGILNEVIQGNKETQDVFGKIARAIHHHASSRSKKKDWNTMVRRSTTVRDPIGNSREADLRQSRQSMKQHIAANHRAALLSMDAEKLVEYNPKLSAVTPATRVAYAKFKVANLTRKLNDTNNEADENVTENSKDTSVSDGMFETKEGYECHPEKQTDMMKPASSASPRKKSGASCVGASASCSSEIPDELPPRELSSCTETKPEETADSSVNDETPSQILSTSSSSVTQDFRTRTPIQEEDDEGNTEDTQEAGAKNNKNINRQTSEPRATETVSLKKPPMKSGGKSKLSGEVLTGWL
jgi:transient receptor potential cation channel subfamily C